MTLAPRCGQRTARLRPWPWPPARWRLDRCHRTRAPGPCGARPASKCPSPGPGPLQSKLQPGRRSGSRTSRSVGCTGKCRLFSQSWSSSQRCRPGRRRRSRTHQGRTWRVGRTVRGRARATGGRERGWRCWGLGSWPRRPRPVRRARRGAPLTPTAPWRRLRCVGLRTWAEPFGLSEVAGR